MEKLCEWCEAVFITSKKAVKRGWGRFCSRSCAAKHENSLRPIGISKTRTRARAREIWKERHGGEDPLCRICGAPADVHHKDGNPFNNEPENQDTLCRSHHIAHENHINPKRKKQAGERQEEVPSSTPFKCLIKLNYFLGVVARK